MMTPLQQLLHVPEGWGEIDLPAWQEEPLPLRASALYALVEQDASFKVGTCEHCVLVEPGRPASAWDANGDTELDFDRDRYFALLGKFGIVIGERQAYVCP